MAERADIIPNITTPEKLAETLGVSPRRVRDDVRALGCYCKIGRAVIMREHHVKAFMEAMECHSGSSSAAKSGTTGAPSPEGDYAALVARRTKKSPKELTTFKVGCVDADSNEYYEGQFYAPTKNYHYLRNLTNDTIARLEADGQLVRRGDMETVRSFSLQTLLEVGRFVAGGGV